MNDHESLMTGSESGADLPPDAFGDDAPVKVLLVDDVPQNLLALRALLQRPGWELLEAPSGAQALELLLSHDDVALALLDVQMPEMDGFALAELMRGARRTREIPIIFVTAAPGDPGRAFRGYEAGAVDFLYKPLDAQVLECKVHAFVQMHRQRRLLQRRNEDLARLLKLHETMVAVLSHDLRAPLSAILMSAELLRRTAQSESGRRSAERIRDSGRRMSSMITQLLDFSRIRAGTLALDAQPGELQAACAAAVEELRQAHPQALIEVDMRGDLHGAFDAPRLTQVFSNLLGNALQHGTPGTPVRVMLDGSEADRLRASVLNSGRLPPQMQSRLFEPFKGGQGGQDAQGGLGLGLYIVDHFVRAHGGTVSARETPEGVCFEFTLPRRASGGA